MYVVLQHIPPCSPYISVVSLLPRHLGLLHRSDRLERLKTGITEHNAFVNASLEDIERQHPVDGNLPELPPIVDRGPSTFSTPRFLRVNNRVLISNGPAKGSKGTINKLSGEIVIIDLENGGGRTVHSDSSNIIQAEVSWENVTRLFDLGDSVEVKIGTFVGRHGIVGDIQGTTLSIVDRECGESVNNFHFIGLWC